MNNNCQNIKILRNRQLGQPQAAFGKGLQVGGVHSWVSFRLDRVNQGHALLKKGHKHLKDGDDDKNMTIIKMGTPLPRAGGET
jgi:hypothetical protein